MKRYVPKEEYIVENEQTKDSYTLDSDRFYYLKKGKAIYTDKDN